MTEFHKGTGLEIFTLCLHWADAQHTCSAYKHIFTATGVYNFDSFNHISYTIQFIEYYIAYILIVRAQKFV